MSVLTIPLRRNSRAATISHSILFAKAVRACVWLAIVCRGIS